MSSLNAISVIVRILSGLITSKVIAIFVGPAGMGLLKNLRNFMTTAEGVATIGFPNGIIKFATEAREDQGRQLKLYSTAAACLLLVSVVSFLVLFLFANRWSLFVFGDLTYSNMFKILAIALPLYAVSLFITAVVTGLGETKKVIYISISGHISGLLGTVLLAFYHGIFGAMLSLAAVPAPLFFVSLWYARGKIGGKVKLSVFDFALLPKLLSFSVMSLVAAFLMPITYLQIRRDVISSAGLEAAGYWEAIGRISTYYLMFVTTLLGIYYLPKLSLARHNADFKRVYIGYFRNILPPFCAALTVLYFLRDWVVRLLFSKAFLPMEELFFWQLLGDVFKVAFLIGCKTKI